MILKLCMQHRGLELFKVYINGDPGLTLTYFTARSNLGASAFEWKKTVTAVTNQLLIKWDKLAANDQINRKITFLKKRIDPGVVCPLSRIYSYYFQTALSLKPLGQ